MWVGSDTKTASSIPFARRIAADRLERLEGRPAAVLDEDPVVRHAVREGVGPGDGGLGRPVAVELAAGHDEVAIVAGQEQGDGVVEPGGEDRRRTAVVLGGAEDDDGPGRSALVAAALVPDPERAVGRDERRRRRIRRR